MNDPKFYDPTFRSLWDRITPEELAAERLVLLPAHLVQPWQRKACADWLRKQAEEQFAEAEVLQAETDALEALQGERGPGAPKA